VIFPRLISALLILTVGLPLQAETGDRTQAKPSVLKSTLIPGWGEHSFGDHTRGYLFNGIEAALWIFAGVASSTASAHENDLYYYAAEYGQITDPHKKSDIFLDRVSKYESMDAYNEQMLRNRQWDRVYSAEDGYYWKWESDETRGEFFDIKTRRYLWRQRLTYSFGAIALNHLVSTMDALYLKRLNATVAVAPGLMPEGAGMSISFTF